MCGRYVTPEQAAMERFWHIGRHNWRGLVLPLFNVAPTGFVPIIIRAEDGVLELTGARWGLVPHWWKNPDPPSMTFNARSEEAAQKPMWRQALKSKRCLMPVRGWYEWQVLSPAQGKTRAVKQPYFIHDPESDVMAFAGLWSTWGADGEPLASCALMTRAAAPSVAQVHDRMPVVLKPSQFGEWLDPATSPARVQEIIADSRTDFAYHPVSTRVNSARNESPDLILPLAAQAP
jgi:putative SOS response-associated peptidase YedK